jgi:hypothetical protein
VVGAVDRARRRAGVSRSIWSNIRCFSAAGRASNARPVNSLDWFLLFSMVSLRSHWIVLPRAMASPAGSSSPGCQRHGVNHINGVIVVIIEHEDHFNNSATLSAPLDAPLVTARLAGTANLTTHN